MKNIITLLSVRESESGDFNRGYDYHREEVNLRSFTSKDGAIDIGSAFLGHAYDEEQADRELGCTYMTVMINGVPLSGHDYNSHIDYHDEHTDSVLESLQPEADDIYNAIMEAAVRQKERARKVREELERKSKMADALRREKEYEEQQRREYEKLKAKFESK